MSKDLTHPPAIECIGSDHVRAAYNTRSNDIWALGVILTSMISGHNPWNNACPDDPCYRVYIKNNNFLREMLPISPAAGRCHLPPSLPSTSYSPTSHPRHSSASGFKPD